MKKSASSMPQGDHPETKSALQRAAALCSRQERCTGYIRERLSQWNVKADDAEKIIRKLQEEKFLDDDRYALFYAKEKFRFNGWGRVKIAHMLRQHGIGEESIGQALEEIDEEAYFQACFELVTQKSASLKEKNLYARKGKLYRFAAGRGFEPDLIHRVLNLVEQE
jgi:regulatory protein